MRQGSIEKCEVLKRSFLRLFIFRNFMLGWFCFFMQIVMQVNLGVCIWSIFGYVIFSCSFLIWGRFRFIILVFVDSFRYNIFNFWDFILVFWILKIFISVRVINIGMQLLMLVRDFFVILIYWRVRFFSLGNLFRLFVLRYMFFNFKCVNFLFVLIQLKLKELFILKMCYKSYIFSYEFFS